MADEANGNVAVSGEAVVDTEAKGESSAMDIDQQNDDNAQEAGQGADDDDGAKADAADTSTPAKGANGRRKSTATAKATEARVKKLAKKKSTPRVTNLNARPGEYYLARFRSSPPWPSIVCDEDMLPESFSASRPVSAKRADGTYTELYADGGDKMHERTFPMLFMGTNEFAWMVNSSLKPTSASECSEALEKGEPKVLLKSKPLHGAFEVAAEGHELPYFKELLADHQKALDAVIEEKEAAKEAKAAARAAAKATKQTTKKKRKSTAAPEESQDEEMEDAGGKKKSVKKRKKDVESDGESEKPSKTPKTTQKLKLTTPKNPASEKKAPKSGKSRQKKEKDEAEEEIAEEEESDETPQKVVQPVDPREASQRRQTEVRFYRFKLQKGLLTRDDAPSKEEMDSISEYLGKLEKEYANLEVSIIRATKIHRVLKGIIKLPSIPFDEELLIKDRSKELLRKWNHLLRSDVVPVSADKPAANGTEETKEDVKEEVKTAEGEADGDAATKDKDEKDVTMADAEADDREDAGKADAGKEAADDTVSKEAAIASTA